MCVTWEDLVHEEPELAALEGRIKAIGLAEIKRCLTDHADFDADAIWFGYDGRISYKKSLCNLVGWSREDNPILGTSTAYSIAYRRIFGILETLEECFVLWEGQGSRPRPYRGGFDG
jgi:hypothetical protein